MSTAASLITEIQDRIPEEKYDGILPAINRGIKLINKRLFVLRSELVKGDLNVSVFAADTYTANTISFVDSGEGVADTITDSANGFVTAGFVAGMPIYTTSTNNPGPFRIATVAAGTITLVSTDSLVSEAAGTEWTITSDCNYGFLPADFQGLVERPYKDGYLQELVPLPNQNTKIQYTSASDPVYYELRTNKIYVIPGAAADITLKGDYWKKPTVITDMDDTMPFLELFDETIQEFVVAILTGAAGDMTSFIREEVDLIAATREKKAPTAMPGGLDYNNFLGD